MARKSLHWRLHFIEHFSRFAPPSHHGRAPTRIRKSDAKCMILENVFLATCVEAAFVKISSASIHPTDTYCLRQWLPWKRFHKSSLSVLERENRNKWTDMVLRISLCLNEGCAFLVLSLTTKPHVPVADTQSERFLNNGGW